MQDKNLVSFEDIGFHDCKIYACGFDSEKNQLLIDIDFITQWIDSEGGTYSFGVLPATLIFENVWDLLLDVSMDINLFINNIERTNPVTPRNIDYLPINSKEYSWRIELLQGEICFKSIGFSMYYRQPELIQKSQTLTMEARGGICLKKEGVLYQIDSTIV